MGCKKLAPHEGDGGEQPLRGLDKEQKESSHYAEVRPYSF